MNIYSDKLAHSLAQMFTREDTLARCSGVPSMDDVKSHNELTTSFAPSWVLITRVCDEHLFGQVSTCTCRYQLLIFCCTNVHLQRYVC